VSRTKGATAEFQFTSIARQGGDQDRGGKKVRFVRVFGGGEKIIEEEAREGIEKRRAAFL